MVMPEGGRPMHGTKIDRRSFLGGLIGAGAVGAVPAREASRETSRGRSSGKPSVGLALGAGGARGLAHALMIEALDELGISPCRISGSSIGAIMGCLAAAGLEGREIRELIDHMVVTEQDQWLQALRKKDVFKWIEFIDPQLGQGGLVDGDSIIRFLHETVQRSRFEELAIPLEVVAADFWTREQVVFNSGELLPPLEASIAVPGLFSPVQHGGRVLVDGGTVNPVPYDLLLEDCDLTVAVDVSGSREPDADRVPSYFETIFNTFQIMQHTILHEKLRRLRPHVLVEPDIRDVQVLEFYKAELVYRQSEAAKEGLKRQLDALLSQV